MNKNMIIGGVVVLILIGGILFFVTNGFKSIQKMLGNPKDNFGEFGGSNTYFARIGESLGLPEGTTKEQVLEALDLPEDASKEQIKEALQQKGITLIGGNKNE